MTTNTDLTARVDASEHGFRAVVTNADGAFVARRFFFVDCAGHDWNAPKAADAAYSRMKAWLADFGLD